MQGQTDRVPAQQEDRAGAGRMTRAKGFWTVTAGVLLNESMPEYGKQWCYTSADYEQDIKNAENGEETGFMRMDREAHEYARSITHPSFVNWVKMEFLWV
jgi:hypothetical protein